MPPPASLGPHFRLWLHKKAIFLAWIVWPSYAYSAQSKIYPCAVPSCRQMQMNDRSRVLQAPVSFHPTRLTPKVSFHTICPHFSSHFTRASPRSGHLPAGVLWTNPAYNLSPRPSGSVGGADRNSEGGARASASPLGAGAQGRQRPQDPYDRVGSSLVSVCNNVPVFMRFLVHIGIYVVAEHGEWSLGLGGAHAMHACGCTTLQYKFQTV